MTNQTVLGARDLGVSIMGPLGPSEAVRGIDIELYRGETLGIVGESGCGKSLTALALSGLLPDGVRISRGQISILGEVATEYDEALWRRVRGRSVALIFQDPMAMLNPVLTIGAQICEAIQAHKTIRWSDARREAVSLLGRVRLPDPQRIVDCYPHQLSGGMAQRVAIAIAIANRPDILIADEPTTALDATVQIEILALLKDIQRETGMAILIVSHDLELIARWADRVLVMYAGKAVEVRSARDILTKASHPYTLALIASRPRRRLNYGRRQRLEEIPGRVPLPSERLSGCGFAERCAVADDQCKSNAPDGHQIEDGTVWCHHAIGCEAIAQ
jgi:peptide/nickel transport system ATP-binding protein